MRDAIQIVNKFLLTDNDLTELRDGIAESMSRGLHTKDASTIKMLPSFVENLPSKDGNSTYVALDLGGTNFRVLLINIVDDNIDMDSQIYSVPQSIMRGQGQDLFDLIAECMSDFIHRKGFQNQKIYCGFTFSFPVDQTSIKSASLIQWTKGFCAEGVEGQDVVAMLEKALSDRGDIDCEILAVLNDTVGTMMSCAFEDQSTEIGLIAGTGSNACYFEDRVNIRSLGFTDASDGSQPQQDGKMIINTEWGAYGDDGALNRWLTEYDDIIDQNSVNVGRQRYEKMIAGMYLGEIVRLVLLDMCKKGIVFTKEEIPKLSEKDSFLTQTVSQVIENQPRKFMEIQNILVSIGLTSAIKKDCSIVHMVCDAVSRRAAHMCASGVAAIATKIHANRPDEYLDLTCGVDGSVYKKHPTFSKFLQVKTNELVGPGIHVHFKLSHDGSGKGAALVTSSVEGSRRQSVQEVSP